MENVHSEVVTKRTRKKGVCLKEILVLPTGTYVLPAAFVKGFKKTITAQRRDHGSESSNL
jgi:hypothetical protein